jgi:hypothetical protein
MNNNENKKKLDDALEIWVGYSARIAVLPLPGRFSMRRSIAEISLLASPCRNCCSSSRSADGSHMTYIIVNARFI